MLTPRHQALLATLAGMTVGVAVFGTVLAVNRDNGDSTSSHVVSTPSQTPGTPGPTDGLQAASLQYVAQTFGTKQCSGDRRGADRLGELPGGHQAAVPGPDRRLADPVRHPGQQADPGRDGRRPRRTASTSRT